VHHGFVKSTDAMTPLFISSPEQLIHQLSGTRRRKPTSDSSHLVLIGMFWEDTVIGFMIVIAQHHHGEG